MLELWIALSIFVAIILVAASGHFIQGHMLLIVGGFTATIGLTVGVVVGIRYHIALYRAFSPLGMLRPRWWWNPSSYNPRLPSSHRREVMVWFYAGVVSMVVVLVGCALIFLGILTM